MHALYSIGLAECFKLALRHARGGKGIPSFKATRYQDDSRPNLTSTFCLLFSPLLLYRKFYRISRRVFSVSLSFSPKPQEPWQQEQGTSKVPKNKRALVCCSAPLPNA